MGIVSVDRKLVGEAVIQFRLILQAHRIIVLFASGPGCIIGSGIRADIIGCILLIVEYHIGVITQVIAQFYVVVLCIEVVDHPPAPAVLVFPLQFLACIYVPENIFFPAFVMKRIFFPAFIAERCAEGGADPVVFGFFGDDIDYAALGIGAVKGGGRAFQYFDMVNGVHIDHIAYVSSGQGVAISISSHAVYQNHYIFRAVDINLVTHAHLAAGALTGNSDSRHMLYGLTHIVIVLLFDFLRRHHGHVGVGIDFLFRHAAGGDYDAIQGVHRHVGRLNAKSAAGK